MSADNTPVPACLSVCLSTRPPPTCLPACPSVRPPLHRPAGVGFLGAQDIYVPDEALAVTSHPVDPGVLKHPANQWHKMMIHCQRTVEPVSAPWAVRIA